MRESIRKFRKFVLRNSILSLLLGLLWNFIPNIVRVRLPINSTGFGFLGYLKPFRWTLDPRDLISQRYFSKGFKNYEPLTRKVLFDFIELHENLNGFHFLNVGANTGLWGLIIGKKFPKVLITLVEPIPANLLNLKRNMRLNRLHPEILEVAAGNEQGLIDMFENPDLFGMASVTPNGLIPTKVKMERIDDIILSKVHLVLIDVEGHEFEALQGMQNLLKKYHPMTIVEISADKYESILKLMMRIGYGEPQWLGTEKRFGPKEKNFVFRPKNV